MLSYPRSATAYCDSMSRVDLKDDACAGTLDRACFDWMGDRLLAQLPVVYNRRNGSRCTSSILIAVSGSRNIQNRIRLRFSTLSDMG